MKTIRPDEALLFIDSMIYINLYRTVHGQEVLSPLLSEQSNHIFVTEQIVNEVERNKIKVAVVFLKDHFAKLKLEMFEVPNHLFGASKEQNNEITSLMKELSKKVEAMRNKVNALSESIIEHIRKSQDNVSVTLAPIFAKAVKHTNAEWERATVRRERGNPPGYKDDPVGDQLNWEQILSRFKGKKALWIISKDSDYGTAFGKKVILNQFLYNELRSVSPEAEVFFFNDVIEGIKDFAAKTGEPAQNTPTPEKEKEWKEEEKALPPINAKGAHHFSRGFLGTAIGEPLKLPEGAVSLFLQNISGLGSGIVPPTLVVTPTIPPEYFSGRFVQTQPPPVHQQPPGKEPENGSSDKKGEDEKG